MKHRNPFIAAVLAAALAPWNSTQARARRALRRRERLTTGGVTYKPNGERERARRMRQIRRGQLTASNGLVHDWPGVAR